MAPFSYPPYQQPVTDARGRLATKPWQLFFLSLVAVDQVVTVIPPGTVTIDKLQPLHAPRLLGRGSSGVGPVEEISLGTGLAMTGTLLDVAPSLRVQTLTFVIAHFTSPGANIVTGVAGVLVVPWACTITQVTLLSADPAFTSGSIVVDLWKDSYANYPPTVADTITASAKPTLSSAIKSQDTTLTGWTTALAAGDVIAFNVDSVSGLKRVRVDLQVTLT